MRGEPGAGDPSDRWLALIERLAPFIVLGLLVAAFFLYALSALVRSTNP